MFGQSERITCRIKKTDGASTKKNMEFENESLRLNNKQLSSELNEYKVKCVNLQKNVNLLNEELFQTQTKYNTMKNTLSKVINDVKTGFIPNLINLYNMSTEILGESRVLNNLSSNVRHSIKTQAVKPQIVNGNVLYIPTIALTRFNDSNNVVNNENQISETENDGTTEEEQADNISTNNELIEAQAEGPNLSAIIEETEETALQSPPINSRTYRDVKIFLQNITNVSAKDLNEIYKRNSLESQTSSNNSLTINFSNLQELREFGLSPTSSLATSTPLEYPNRYSSRIEKKNLNTSCHVTKTRSARKIFSPQDVSNVCSNEIEDKTLTPQNTPKLVVKLKSIDKDNVQLNGNQSLQDPSPSTSKKNTKKKRSSKRKTQVKQEPVTPEPTETSERPKRKAKPLNLKEPSLTKKMRRSK